MFTVDQVITDHFPALQRTGIGKPLVKSCLRRLLREQDFTDFGAQYSHLHGIEFIEQVFDYFQFSFAVSDSERENIPPSGKVLIIANHPIGSLDGLALLKLIHATRSDVKIVANDLLMAIRPLRPMLLPVRNMRGISRKRHLQQIGEALAAEQAVIIFPAGEVSRFGLHGIKDGHWYRGFLKIAEQAKAPILPIHIAGRNSLPFYVTSFLAKPLSTVMLVGEMFRQEHRQLRMTIGSIIPYSAYGAMAVRRSDKVKMFKKHLYRIGQGKKPLFATESAIARPERRTELKKAISQGERLGTTPDGKSMYLLAPVDSSPVMREIGRLREQAFRAVGEGSPDYLWYGIGAYLAKNPGYRYLFGAVSISNAMPPLARELLVYFYKLYFPGDTGLPCSRNPFSFSMPVEHLAKEFVGNDYRGDLRRLKSLLTNLGTAIPPLYKQYAELCEPGGVRFIDFNIDPAFSNCVDGLVIVDLLALKEQKRNRYVETTILQ